MYVISWPCCRADLTNEDTDVLKEDQLGQGYTAGKV